MRLAPIGVSTYSRLHHLKQTIEALQKNTLAKASELYIFSDAPKLGDEEKVKKVRSYIHTIDGFKTVNIVERATNSRLNNSRGGMRELLDKYGRIIFMEDDNVTAPGFLQFMNESLNVYEKDKRIFTITGYSPPIDIPVDYGGDVFILRRASGWGFGIWNDRYKKISYLDNDEVQDRFSINNEVEELSKYGEDLLNMILLDAAGKMDALDVKIFYYQFLNEKYTIYPRKSLVRNIGFDGSGIHCGKTNKFDVDLWDKYEFKINGNVKLDDRIIKSNYRFRNFGKVRKVMRNLKSSKGKSESEMDILGEGLIFVISQPRAGSTLLQRIMGSHPEIHTTAEPWIMLHPIYALKRNGLDAEYESSLARQGLDDFLMQVPEGEELYIEALREMANVLYNKMINVSGKKYFLDKTPRYYYIIPELYRVFPKAKFIFLMRNPIAVLSSVLKTWCGNILQNLVNRPLHSDLIKGPHYLLQGIKGLKEDAIIVHYEELVQNPKEVMQHLCKRIGITFYDNMLEYGLHSPPEGRFGDSTGIYKHSKPVSEYVDKWTENLQSPDLIEFSQNYLLDLGPEVISSMGYSYQNIKDKLESNRTLYRNSEGELQEANKFNQQGENLFAKGDLKNALISFTKSLDIDSSNAIVHNNLSVLYYNLGNKEKALSHYKKAAELQPENITFQKNLADFYYVELGRVEEAMQIYIKVLNANPEDIESLLILGHICVALKKFDDAKDFYDRILIIEPWNKDARQFFQKLEEYQLSVLGGRLGSVDIKTASKGYLVSAIVSAYNSERFIRGCLEDLENQTITDRLEIVVVNSGSQENEEAVIKEFQEKYSNIKYIKTDKRETVYAAWNRGIKASTGKYITNANTDDRHRKDAFEVIINMLEQRPEIALVYADLIITETENETFENCTPVGYFSWMNWKREGLLNKGCFMGPQPMWRRDVHDEYGYFDDSLVTSGDYEFWLRISQTNTFLHLPIQLGLYLRSPGSIEHLNREKQREENNKIFEMYRKSNFSGKNIRRVETNSPQASVVKIDGRIEPKLKALNPNTQVSIIIPTSTQQKYIKNCVKSIKKHTPQSHEILFVNNGTTKGTIKWLKKYINENSNHHLVKCPKDAGPAVSVNEGIKASTGQYILVLSNDIVVAKGWLSGMLDCMKRVPDAGIVGPMSNVSSGLQTVAKADNISLDQLDEFAESFMAGNRYRRISSIGLDGFCLLFRRDLVEEIGFFDEQFGQDGFENEDFCLKAILEGRKNLIAGDVYVHQQNRKTFNRSKKYFNSKWNKADTQSPLGKKYLALTAVEKGNESYQKGQIDNAVEILLDGIGLSPNDKRTYYALAEILIHAKQHKDAIDVLNEMPPGEQDAKRLELIGYCKEGMKLYDEAHNYANQALSLNPCLATAINLKGLLAYNKGDNLAAEDFFNRAIESDPGYGETYTNLGAIRWDKNQEEALNLFEKGFILSPTSPDIIANYHTAASALGEFERAGQIFKEAGLLHPNNKNIKYKFIDFLLKLEKHAQAVSQIEEAIDLFGMDDGILSAALNIRELLGPKEIDKTKDKKSTVSLCMIVKNEEQHLAKCLRSVKPIVDEMIIVDTGSTDRTKDIAKVFGAKIYDYKWNDDFSEARNFSISKASGMWILILDADEAISSLDHNKFKKVIEESKPVAYQLTTRNYSLLFNIIGWNANDEKYINENAGSGWISSDKVRLFPNKHGARFEYPIHELIEPSLKKAGLKVKKCKIPIHHYGRLDQKKSDDKNEIYYHIGRKKLDEMGDNAVALCELATQAETLGKHEESIELWERLIKIQPETALAFANMGTAYAKLGKFEKAVSVAVKALGIDPDMKEAHYNYAFAKVHLGEVSEAVLVIEKMQSQFSEYPPAQFLLAVAYCLEARRAKWREGFKKLKIAMGHGLAIACHEFARGLVSAKRPDYAVTLLKAAVESKNSNKEIDELYSKCLEMIDVDKKTGTMGGL